MARCLQEGADPNERDGRGMTPLGMAASIGKAGVVKVLLEAGADPNARNEGGVTPLHTAAMGVGMTPLYWARTAEAVMVLLQAGADPNTRIGVSGETPLHWAALVGTAEVVTALLQAGADAGAAVYQRGKGLQYPFDYAKDNEKIKGTDVYWKLSQARFE